MISSGSSQFDAMQESAISKINSMTDEELKRFGELLVSKGTSSAGIKSYGYSDILNKGATLRANEIAKYGVAGLDYVENKRRFDVGTSQKDRQFDIGTTEDRRQFDIGTSQNASQFSQNLEQNKKQYNQNFAENTRQFDIWTAQKNRELTLYQQQLEDLKDAQKKEQKNWWKKSLGTALGVGLGGIFGGMFSGGNSQDMSSGKLSLIGGY